MRLETAKFGYGIFKEQAHPRSNPTPLKPPPGAAKPPPSWGPDLYGGVKFNPPKLVPYFHMIFLFLDHNFTFK